jgi:DNA polymerase-3 subunit alpha
MSIASFVLLLDGACRISGMAKLAKELGQQGHCITTTGNVRRGRFLRACKAEGKKPIIGCEVYMAPLGRTAGIRSMNLMRESGTWSYCAETRWDIENLCALVSSGY